MNVLALLSVSLFHSSHPHPSNSQRCVYSLCLSMWYNLVLSGPYSPDSDSGLSLFSGVCQIIISTRVSACLHSTDLTLAGII